MLIWGGVATAMLVPVAIATTSPWLAWRHPIYIAAGFAGILALGLLLLQPLLASGVLPGLPARSGRNMHRRVGIGLVVLVVAHVGGLWITSAPDVIDALLFESPTPFSVWGVTAMWATFAAAAMAAMRTRIRLSPRAWRLGHGMLAATIVIGSVAHALLIEGTMGPISKAVLCLLAVTATGKALYDLRLWTVLARRRG